jgi:hypothetical protein
MFPIRNGLKQGDTLPPLLVKFVLQYTIKRVQVDQVRLQLNGTHQLLVYANDASTLGRKEHIIMVDAEALIVASKEIY